MQLINSITRGFGFTIGSFGANSVINSLKTKRINNDDDPLVEGEMVYKISKGYPKDIDNLTFVLGLLFLTMIPYIICLFFLFSFKNTFLMQHYMYGYRVVRKKRNVQDRRFKGGIREEEYLDLDLEDMEKIYPKNLRIKVVALLFVNILYTLFFLSQMSN